MRDALRGDQSLRDRFPHLRRRPVADVRVLAVVEPVGTPVEHRAVEALGGAWANPAGLCVRTVVMWMRTGVQPLRKPDDAFSAVSSQVPYIRVDWVADGMAATPTQAAVTPDALALPAPRTALGGTSWRLPSLAVLWLIFLLFARGAAVCWVVGTPIAP